MCVREFILSAVYTHSLHFSLSLSLILYNRFKLANQVDWILLAITVCRDPSPGIIDDVNVVCCRVKQESNRTAFEI